MVFVLPLYVVAAAFVVATAGGMWEICRDRSPGRWIGWSWFALGVLLVAVVLCVVLPAG
ncbi:hypothetical protein [Crossiella equi]|uniref:hypothetical protein n=1 Tax=Crossiella equi TaxID=130796 RepID=UPI001AE146EF|nr:hypothetical protein [Crossiella equi]